MHLTLVNLLGVATIAFFVPFLLGFFPKVRIPASPWNWSPASSSARRCLAG